MVIPNSSWVYIGNRRVWVSAHFNESGDVYLYVPRDGRYRAWHKPYWVGTPEYARDKLADGTHWVMSSYAETQASVLLAFYPEAHIIR